MFTEYFDAVNAINVSHSHAVGAKLHIVAECETTSGGANPTLTVDGVNVSTITTGASVQQVVFADIHSTTGSNTSIKMAAAPVARCVDYKVVVHSDTSMATTTPVAVGGNATTTVDMPQFELFSGIFLMFMTFAFFVYFFRRR